MLVVLLIVYFQDFHNPLYIAERIGKNGKTFNMYKIRSMIIDAELTGVDSTSNDDAELQRLVNLLENLKLMNYLN